MKILVYSTESCPHCIHLKEWLKENKIEYKEIDVSKDEAKAKEMIEKSGQMGVPQIEINGKIVVGFNKEKLKELLKIET